MIWKKQPVGSKLEALSSEFFTEVESGTDLNNLKTPGFYGVKSGTVAGSLSNSPITNTSFAIIVQRKSSSYISQLAYTGERFYMRSQYSNGFQPWSELALNSKIATTAITRCTVSSTDARFKSASSSVEKCYRTGNVVVLRIATRWDFSSSNFNVGDDVTMTVTGIPSPLVVVSAAAYHTSRLMVGSIDTDKTINVRNITSVNNNSNAPLSFTFVYVCND